MTELNETKNNKEKRWFLVPCCKYYVAYYENEFLPHSFDCRGEFVNKPHETETHNYTWEDGIEIIPGTEGRKLWAGLSVFILP